MGRNLEMPWRIEDTVENMEYIRSLMVKQVQRLNLDRKGKQDVKEIHFDFNRVEEALKKQIPIKPLCGGNTDKLSGDIFICPSCSGIVGIDDMKAAYCADCGQKLDWEN